MPCKIRGFHYKEDASEDLASDYGRIILPYGSTTDLKGLNKVSFTIVLVEKER